MGFRTVVILNNDRASEWQHDPELGQRIAAGMNRTHDFAYDSLADLGYGRVVECEHADTQTLAVIDSIQYDPIVYNHWSSTDTKQSVQLKLLKQFADKLGYRLVKKVST